ncbi:DinB family protein [Brevibacillus brevis]|uniref:DinB family protein n=1 Tax=Brevibacillus brevis TaxID=1393 RepID=UPI0025A564BD|nr:DinB family protein [Brevibacillus brevis]WJQ82742.1 DinB family protein [Brevibacillus brevis]
MNRKELLLHGWECAYDKEDWYPPLKEVLSGVSAAEASWRPVGEAANTIWENISHLLYYKERLLHRLLGTEFPSSAETNDDTFTPSGGPADEDAWQATLLRMESVHRHIHEQLSLLTDEELNQMATYTPIYQNVMSLVLHDAFHTGQIVQIRKLQGSWPARRSFD